MEDVKNEPPVDESAADPADANPAGQEIDVAMINEVAAVPPNQLAEAMDIIDKLRAENAALRASLAAQKGQTTRAREQVAAIAAEQGSPRKLGPMKEQPEGIDLLTAIGGAGTVHLAFSDGRKEVTGLAPCEIVGAAWKLRAGRVKLEVPSLLVHGPAPGKPAFTLGGYALLLDGKQVAFAARDPLAIGGGQQVELKDDVIF